MITSVKEIIETARKGGYAVGAFNTVNIETTHGILMAAQELKSPVIIQMTEKTMDYAGGRVLFHAVKEMAECYYAEIPVGIHLDHGKSFEIIQHAVEIGLTSVMYDGSRKKFADNVSITKKVVEFCKEKGVHVQGELGNVPYIGEVEIADIDWDKYMTDPNQAKKFVEETGIDILAVAIGNAHGFTQERSVPDYERLDAIRELVDVPFVMHGASNWMDERIPESIKRGVACFNVDTSSRLAFMNSLTRTMCDNKDMSFDIRKHLGDARDALKESVKRKMELYGSTGKA